MKKLTKTLFAVAAVTAVSAAMTVSAMAATTENITGTYEDGVVTLNGVVSSGASQTILILTEDVNVTSENADSVVVAIDQDDNQRIFSNVKVKAFDENAVDTLYVRIGGSEGNLQKGEISVKGGGGVEPGDTITVKIGNINNDAAGRINSSDSTALAQWQVKIYNSDNSMVGKTYNVVDGADLATIKIGNINNDAAGRINSSDSTALAQWQVKIYNSDNELVNNEVILEAEPVAE